MARLVTFDEIVFTVHAEYNLTHDQRVELLQFLHDFKQDFNVKIKDQILPPALVDKVQIVVS